MNTIKTAGIVVVAVVLSVFVGSFFNTSTTIVEQKQGAVAGPESPNDYSCNAGVCTYYRKATFSSLATTTQCSMKTPAATTTMITASAYGNRTVSNGATTYDFTLSSAPFATSSDKIVATATWATGGQINVATTTMRQVAPNQYIVLRLSTSTVSTTWDAKGSCSAVFVDAF